MSQDTLSSAERSRRMSAIRHKNTQPELVVRKIISGIGYRYRLNVATLPGKPDLVFRSRNRIIFVHGCFWHRHPSKKCALARLPKSKLDFWLPKLSGNAERDRRNLRLLRKMGWKVLVVWECQLRDKERLKNTLRSFLEGKQ